jgi:AraC-like DNA-binding protein
MENSEFMDVSQSRLDAWFSEAFEVSVLFAACAHLAPAHWNHPSLPNYHWRLYRNTISGAELIVDNHPLTLLSDSIYLVAPHQSLSSRNEMQFDQIYIHFDLTYAMSTPFEKLIAPVTQVPLSPLLSQMIDCMSRQLDQTPNNDIISNCMAKALIFQTFAEWFVSLPIATIKQYADMVSLVAPILPALHVLEKEPYEPIKNKILAQLCLLSEDHFIHVFTKAVGMPPRQYQLRTRLALAAQMLMFTKASIEQIAEKLCFTDRFYFSRLFKRETGHTPAEFRGGQRY